jgi:hypothetical protein
LWSQPTTFFQFGIGIGIGIGIGFSPGLSRLNTHPRSDRCRRQYLCQFLPTFVFDSDADSDPDLKLIGGILIEGKSPEREPERSQEAYSFRWKRRTRLSNSGGRT